MSEKFVLNSRSPVETNVRFERLGSTYRQILGVVVAFLAIFGARLSSFAAETAQVVFFSAPVAVQTEAYSSPSPQAYATGEISEGEYVEIFFRLPQGYCAIKPPKGSFSWVNGKFLRTTNGIDGQIELAPGKKAPARIGGESPEVSSVVQVGLQNRQRVKIIGKTQLADGSVWYKIAPPPGEFRWIKTSDLVSDPVLEQIPEKLTFQSEYLANRKASQEKNFKQDSDASATDSDELNFAEEVYPESSAKSTQEFKREIAELNADTFQAIQKSPRSQEELSLLEKRAEELFDAAPTDDDRFFVQSVYEIVKKAQAAPLQSSASNPFAQGLGYYGENAFQTLIAPGVDGAHYGGSLNNPSSFENFGANSLAQTERFANGQFVGSQFDAAQFSGVPFVDQSNLNAPILWNSPGGFAQGAPNVYGTPRASTRNESASGSRRMEFAFSGSNTPFKSKKREARIVYGSSKPASRTSSSLSKLPTLFPAASQEIVPPSSYNSAYGIGISPIRQNARLLAEAQKKKNEEIVFAQNQKALKDGKESKVEVAQSAPKASSETSKSNDANVASLTSKNESNNSSKIRQTSAFTPVASPTNQGFDAVGTLTELSDVSEGSPRYALNSPSHEGGIVYLVPAEGVSFAPYVGQKVGVKGSSGAVYVENRSQKLVVVGSIFPL